MSKKFVDFFLEEKLFFKSLSGFKIMGGPILPISSEPSQPDNTLVPLDQWFLTFLAPWTPKGPKKFHGP